MGQALDLTKVTVMGYGRVGRALAGVLDAHGLLQQVYNRSVVPDSVLLPGISYLHDLADLAPSDLYILCVADDAIEEVAQNLGDALGVDQMVVHVSGATPVDVLSRFAKRGFLYPLYTFGEPDDVHFGDMPIFVGATDTEFCGSLRGLASKLSLQVYPISEESKLALHLAAVFANNFTNRMLVEAYDLCQANDIPFVLLRPIIERTLAAGAGDIPPSELQTGPAMRGDSQVMQAHMAMLEDIDPDLRDIYRRLSIRINNQLEI